MKDKTRENIIFVGLYGLLVFSSLGAMVGTYAWFEYNSRIKAQFHGTAVNRSGGSLRVGLYTEQELPEASSHGLSKDGYYYWAEDGLSSDTLNYFLSACGYASDTLFPLTSGHYVTNGNFTLKENPTVLSSNINDLAEKRQYIELPLAFAVGSERQTSANFSIKLSEAKLECSSRLKEAVRMHFEVGEENFTFAPIENDDGYDVVGGYLDLDRDGFIDYVENTMNEYAYGDVENISYKSEANVGGTPEVYKNRNCFNGVHHQGTHSLNDDVILKTSEYLGKRSVLSNKIVSTMHNGYARANITLYAEGWASGLIDEVVGTGFNLDLKFEIVL